MRWTLAPLLKIPRVLFRRVNCHINSLTLTFTFREVHFFFISIEKAKRILRHNSSLYVSVVRINFLHLTRSPFFFFFLKIYTPYLPDISESLKRHRAFRKLIFPSETRSSRVSSFPPTPVSALVLAAWIAKVRRKVSLKILASKRFRISTSLDVYLRHEEITSATKMSYVVLRSHITHYALAFTVAVFFF